MTNTLPSVHLNDDRQAVNFVPDLNDQQQLAVVDMDVLKYLVGLLPQADISKIMHTFFEKSQGKPEIRTIEQWCELLQSELNFHRSVNLLQQHLLKPEPQEQYQSAKAH